jgi:transcriptional regulator with XRE-family HTH domain
MYSRFVQLIEEKETTAYQVSKATGIPASTFSDWKKGKSEPKMEKLQKISEYFNVSTGFILGTEGVHCCPGCGLEYDLNNKNQNDFHNLRHYKWTKAVEKYGFCWNYFEREIMMNILI